MPQPLTTEGAYRAAHESSLAVRHDSPGLLHALGDDRLDLLHRMSTNDLESLGAGGMRQTVFTDPVGRTIDVVTVLQGAERAALVGLPGRGGQLRDWLQRHIFFQDQVTLEPPEGEPALWGLYGPAADVIAGEWLDTLPEHGRFSPLDQGYLWPVGSPVHGLRLLNPPADVSARLEQLDAGAAGRQAYEALRIEAGLPAPDHEIRPDSIPLEVGLQAAISFSKGCYIGQEIIARMESRGRLAKQLVRLRFDGQVEPGVGLEFDGRAVGTVTSVVNSPDRGWIGLASLRSTAAGAHSFQLQGSSRTAELVDPVPAAA